MNRLARERSPYLQQHAHNPVDWYPWGEEAFAKARAEDKPIFLSIGYSTCHWCHVMEHESFEHVGIATLLNNEFVPVKVDREERPDVDRVYMTFVQGTTGAGGWPMSVFLTPGLKPFFGGTYFPPESRWGRPGFADVLRELAQVWRADRAKIEQSADSVTEQLRGSVHATVADALPSADLLPRIVAQFRTSFDPRQGGFGEAPKFPRPSELLFLLREHARTGDADALAMVLATLRAMALGGMRDHLGGGFHRYSVDAAWRVPHFEKMLYDQAQLALAYLEAAQASGDGFYIDVAEDTLRYVMRQMTAPEGGFFSAEDADSVPPDQADAPDAHKMEGAFYLWTSAEVDALLGEASPIVKRRFGIMTGGNAPSDPQQEFVGKNILHVAAGIDVLATEFQKTGQEIEETLAHARVPMFRARVARPHPQLDDKVLTAWNGLMIAAFARAARLLNALGADGQQAGAPYLRAAKNAATFIHSRMWNAASLTLTRRYRDGHAEIDGFAEDYAYLIYGLLELFQADPDVLWLDWAVALQKRQDALFWDQEHGGWFSTTGRDETVLVRMKEDYDGAEPTASSVSVANLLALGHLVDDPSYWTRIEGALKLFAARLEQMGRAVPMMAAAFSTFTAGMQQVVIVGTPDPRQLSRRVALRYRPFTIALTLNGEQQQALAARMPWLASMAPLDRSATAYVCRDFVCAAPVTTADELERAVSESY